MVEKQSILCYRYRQSAEAFPMMLLEVAALTFMTLNVYSRGSSATAQYVLAEADKGRRHLQDSYSLGLRRTGVLEELCAVVDERRDSNWDGYGAAPLTIEAYRNAYLFLEALPFG